MSVKQDISTNGPKETRLHLYRIDPEPSLVVRQACSQLEVADQVVRMTLDLYRRKGFVPPWVGHLAEEDARIVGSCGFAGPPTNGEAEIAYFTFPGSEGMGIATRMAAALMRETRRTATAEVFIAHTLPAEGPSTSILKRLGFECLGVIEHAEDGSVWKWRESGTFNPLRLTHLDVGAHDVGDVGDAAALGVTPRS